jgi:hypothetical protein
MVLRIVDRVTSSFESHAASITALSTFSRAVFSSPLKGQGIQASIFVRRDDFVL